MNKFKGYLTKDKVFVLILILLLGVLLVIQHKYIIKNYKKDDPVLTEIAKLEKKIDSLSNKRDTLNAIIIEVDKKILLNQKTHEKVVDTIISQPSSDDSVFARKYIEKFINERTR